MIKLVLLNLGLILLTFPVTIMALYGSNSDVIQVGAQNFKDEVLKQSGIVIVEFFAPWCGHCKSLAPEYEKAATLLKGVVKIVAVDATAHESLAQKYQIQGFPTIKVFGADKKKPVDYQGQRTADGIVAEAMTQTNQLVKSRKAGKSSGGSGKGGDSKEKKSKGKKANDVIELTEANFNALVLESKDHWLVEFYAPWCGHCKNLAPHWKKAATELKSSGVKLGALDATAATNLAQKYGIKGFPTIKIFPAGPKTGKAEDYNGPRETDGIVEAALKSLDAAGAPVEVTQITSLDSFQSICGSKKLCTILFLPHILDSGAKGRTKYLDDFADVARNFRKLPFAFAWTEGTAQPVLEIALNINGNFPTLAVLSPEKKVYAVNKLSFTKKNIESFMNGVLSGSEKTTAWSTELSIVTVPAWDGKDGQLAVDEIPLDELFKD